MPTAPWLRYRPGGAGGRDGGCPPQFQAPRPQSPCGCWEAGGPPRIQAGQSGRASGMWRTGRTPLPGVSTALTGTAGEHSGPGPPGPGCRFCVWSEEEAERLGSDEGLLSLSLCPRPLHGWFWNDPVAHSNVHKAVSGPQEGFRPAAPSWPAPGQAGRVLAGRGRQGSVAGLGLGSVSGCRPLPSARWVSPAPCSARYSC